MKNAKDCSVKIKKTCRAKYTVMIAALCALTQIFPGFYSYSLYPVCNQGLYPLKQTLLCVFVLCLCVHVYVCAHLCIFVRICSLEIKVAMREVGLNYFK
jgi:hypothetical protein